MSKPLHFRGVAHPPPSKSRSNIADLSRAEISTTNLGKGGGTSLLVEHDFTSNVGHVNASWEGKDGSLRVSGTVTDPDAIAMVRKGDMRGLSLGTSVIQDESGNALLRSQDELSLCAEPRRGGCYIDTLDGKSVRTVECFSNANRTRIYATSHFISRALPAIFVLL